MSTAVASTVCSLLIAATLLEVCNLVSVVHCDAIQSSCSARPPVTLLKGTIRDRCVVNNEEDVAIRDCIADCQRLSFTFGIVSPLKQCDCSNDTTFNLNYCCSDLQCDIVCGRLGQQCHPETHRCEYTVPVPVPVGCHTLCIDLGYGGFVHTGSKCTCTDCNGITNVTPRTCAVVSSALLGVAATTSTGDGTFVLTATVGISAAEICNIVNQLDLPVIG